MSKQKDILIINNLAAFEKVVNRDQHPYDINLMVMPGTLEDKHKDVDPEIGITGKADWQKWYEKFKIHVISSHREILDQIM